MSQAVLFEIGAVIFVVVSTAVFWYGLTWFRDWQDSDEAQADLIVAPELANVRAEPFSDQGRGAGTSASANAA